MSETPFIKFYPSDFLAGTSGLSPAERGVYITLLSLIFESDGPIRRDDARLARRCGAPKAAFRRILDGLIEQGKIRETDGMLSNRRAETALMDRTTRTQNASRAADKRWSAQKKKTKQNQGAGDATAMPSQCAEDASEQSQRALGDHTERSVSPPEPSSPLSEAVQIYNETAATAGWPKVQKLTPARSKALRARLDECGGAEGWRVAMQKGLESDFLCGRTDRPWTGCSFDWLTKQSNFTKLMEGNYDNRDQQQRQRAPQRQQDRPDPALEQISRLAGLGQAQGEGGL